MLENLEQSNTRGGVYLQKDFLKFLQEDIGFISLLIRTL